MIDVRRYIIEVFQDYGAYDIQQDRDDKKDSFDTKDTSVYSEPASTKTHRVSTIDQKRNLKAVRKNDTHAQ